MIRYVAIAIVACGALAARVVAAGDSRTEASSGQKQASSPTANQALNLDGKAGYVQVADSESLHAIKGAVTIEAWFKASSFYPDDGDVNSIVRKNTTAEQENFFLRFRTVRGKPAVEFSLGSDIGVLRAPYDFEKNKWYHLAGTYDGKTAVVYVNGVGIKSGECSGPLFIDNSDLVIGKGDPEFSGGEYFHGELDEIRIWNVARSAKELANAMNAPLTGKEAGLVAYWNFDDGTAKDVSPHHNDGRRDENARITETPRPSAPPPADGKTPPAAE